MMTIEGVQAPVLMALVLMALVLLALTTGLSGAASAEGCGQDATQFDLDRCASDELAKADTALNKDYDEILHRLKGDVDARKRLIVAEKAWLAFRDAECDFATADARDGSIYPLVVDGCRSTLTKARTKMLAGYLDCAEGDAACPLPPK